MPTYKPSNWTLTRRKTKTGWSIYYYWYDDEGARHGPKATGVGYEKPSQRKAAEREADRYCEELFDRESLGDQSAKPTLSEWAGEMFFWDWSLSKYVESILYRSPEDKPGITEGHVLRGKRVWEVRIEPVHGNKQIHRITPGDCEDLLRAWKRENVTHKTINNWRSCYSVMLAEAARRGAIDSNPWDRVPQLKVKKNPRGGITMAEGRRILDPSTVDLTNRADCNYYYAMKLAMLTGLRVAEVCGLLTDRVITKKIERDDTVVEFHYLDVVQQWHHQLHKLTPVKDKDARAVPLHPSLYEEIRQFITGPGRFVLSFHREQATPISINRTEEWFNRRCAAIGMSDRRDRNVTFHSSRRFFDTRLRGYVPTHVIERLTGWNDEEMVEHYTDYLPEDLQGIEAAQTAVLRSLQ